MDMFLEDGRRAFCLPRDYGYWTGWEARLILSKRSSPKQKIPSNNNDFNTPITKKIKSGAQGMDLEDRNMNVTAMKHDIQAVSVHHADKIAKVVAAVARSIGSWQFLPSCIGPQYEDQVWRSIIKLVLSIVDVDDIFIVGRDELVCRCRRLFSELHACFDVAEVSKDEHEYERDYFKLSTKWQNQVMNCIAERDKCLGVEHFVGLTDGDVANLILFDIAPAATESTVSAWRPPSFKFAELSVPERIFEIVLEEMETFVPLKENRRMQLALELSYGVVAGKDHVVEYLFVEACKSIMSEDLLKDIDAQLGCDGEDVLSKLAEILFCGLHEFCGGYKLKMSEFSVSGALHPLRCGAFGEFSDEVVQVARIANYERKVRGHRFIDIHDIIVGLSLSSLGGHEIVRRMVTFRPAEEIPQMPLYKVYKVAGELANRLGDDMVELGHFALAVKWFINDIRLAASSLSDCDDGLRATLEDLRQWSAKHDDDGANIAKVKEKGMLHDSKPIYGFDGLVRAIRGGLEVPDIRTRPQHRGMHHFVFE